MNTYSNTFNIYKELKNKYKECDGYFYKNINRVKLEDNKVFITITTDDFVSELYYCKIEKILNDCDKKYTDSRIDFLMFHDKIIGFEMKKNIDGHSISQVQKFINNWFKQNILNGNTSNNISYILCIVYKNNNLRGTNETIKLEKNKIRLLKQGEYKINEL